MLEGALDFYLFFTLDGRECHAKYEIYLVPL